MIDYFNISIDGDDFPPVGKQLRTTQPGGARTKSFTEVNVRVASGAPQFYAQVETRAKRMRFWGSPAQFLQGHNGMGSNDLRPLVKASVLLVFETLELDCPASVLDAISTGEYDLDEVHVAEQYRMPHALVRPFCENIRRNADDSLQATPLEKGIGIRLWPNSRDRQVLMYDKHHYFMDGLRKHKTKLLGNMPMGFDRIGTSLEFDQMKDEVLAQGIRIETRLKRMLDNKANPFNRGTHWKPETARELHRRVLLEVPLLDLPPVPIQEQLLTVASPDHKMLIALWLTGRDMRQFFDSDPTYYRRRTAMINQYGIDMSTPPIPDSGIRWADVIGADSLIEVPAWATESGFVHVPEHWIGWRDPTQNHRSWLRPDPEIRFGKRSRLNAQSS
jgi:hypothetical protein